MKTLFHLGVMVAVALMLMASSASAVNYNPSTTVLIYVHGFDNDGYSQVGVYGDDATNSSTLDVVNGVAGLLNLPTWQTNPTAANQVAGCDYYGDTPPTWYSAADIAADAATPECVPRYALRTAKYIQHVLNRAPSATGITLMSGSFGSEISRYMIEHDLLGLASSQKIARWIPIVGVVRGNWAASNVPGWLADALGGDSPDIDQMPYSWVDSNISSHNYMNTALYGPMVICCFAATHDPDNYLTGLRNEPNDATNLTSDEYFGGYTTSAALHAATNGNLQMPGLSFQPVRHIDIVDSMGMWAGACAAASNNQRVTITCSRFKAKVNADFLGSGEWVYSFRVASPRANTLWGITDCLQNMNYADGVSPLYSLKKGNTTYPNSVIFDQLIPSGETTLNLAMDVVELDWYPHYYEIYELGSTYTSEANFTASVSATGNSTITVSNGNCEADLTTVVRSVY